MPKLRENAKILVKLFAPKKGYDYPKWIEYRANKGRELNLVATWLRGLDSFRYAVIFAYDRKTKMRGEKIGYIDKFTVQH